MEELKELIRVVSKHKIKQIEIIGNHSDGNQDSLFEQLYQIVSDGAVQSDKDAISLLYQDKHSPGESYTKLKNRLKSRLINTLFFIDINQPLFTDIERAFFNCNKNWMAVRILMSRSARVPAIKLAEKTLRVAVKYEFTELILYLAKELRLHYSLVDLHPNKCDKYEELIEANIRILQAELRAEKYYSSIMREYTRSQESHKEHVVLMAVKYTKELTTEFADIESSRFIRLAYQVYILRYQISFQFDKAVDACLSAIKTIKAKPFNSQAILFSFNLRLLSLYVQLMNFDEGETIAQHYSKTLVSGSYNWYVILFYYFLLCTHSKNYQKSYEVLQTAINHPKFSSFYENHKELWYVNEAFVHFLIEANMIDPDQSDVSNPKKFKLYKFLNEIPIYSKDKRGINISILIVHVLLLLQSRKYGKIIDRVDALNQYCHRYLRRDDTLRANCFIKMLLQMPKADFNKIRTQRYAEKYLVKLKSQPLNVAQQGIEVELVPYEELWQMVLELLE